MNDYVLGIDAGGTKTIGVLKCLETRKTWREKGGAGSLSNNIDVAARNITRMVETLLSRAGCRREEVGLVCGAAGAGNPLLRQQLSQKLGKGFAVKEITTDARTSLFGAGMGKAVVVVALGTGSVAMRLDKSGRETEYGGWGFAAGDLGSGAWIGRALVQKMLVMFDAGRAGKHDLGRALFATIGESRPVVLQWLLEAGPAEYAALAKLVAEWAIRDSMAKEIMIDAGLHVSELVALAQGQVPLPLCVLGGLGDILLPYLSADIREMVVESRGDSVDGALFLAERTSRRGVVAPRDVPATEAFK